MSRERTLGVLGFWVTVLALLSWLCVPDTETRLTRALVSWSNVRMITLPPLERAGVETRVGGARSQNVFGQRHSL